MRLIRVEIKVLKNAAVLLVRYLTTHKLQRLSNDILSINVQLKGLQNCRRSKKGEKLLSIHTQAEYNAQFH